MAFRTAVALGRDFGATLVQKRKLHQEMALEQNKMFWAWKRHQVLGSAEGCSCFFLEPYSRETARPTQGQHVSPSRRTLTVPAAGTRLAHLSKDKYKSGEAFLTACHCCNNLMCSYLLAEMFKLFLVLWRTLALLAAVPSHATAPQPVPERVCHRECGWARPRGRLTRILGSWESCSPQEETRIRPRAHQHFVSTKACATGSRAGCLSVKPGDYFETGEGSWWQALQRAHSWILHSLRLS